MKKLMAMLIAALLVMTAATACAAGWRDFPLGMEASAARGILTDLGATFRINDEAVICAETDDGLYVYLNMDADPEHVDWLNVSRSGIILEDEFSDPDWDMTFEELMDKLESQDAAYDLYSSGDTDSVCFSGCLFGLYTDVWAWFENGKLTSIEVSLLAEDISALPWAAAMGHFLGEPTYAGDLEIVDEGMNYDLASGLRWSNVNGNDYLLNHRVSMLVLLRGDEITKVSETRININITPSWE